MENRKLVNTYKVSIVCDECGANMDKQTEVLMSNPPKYTYTCPRCGDRVVSSVPYPYTDFVEVSDDVNDEQPMDNSYNDGSLFVNEARGLEADDILNYYRNLYRAESSDTERGIVAWAINKILPTYTNQAERIIRLQDSIDDYKAQCEDLIHQNTVLLAKVHSDKNRDNNHLKSDTLKAISDVYVKCLDDPISSIHHEKVLSIANELGKCYLYTNAGSRLALSDENITYFVDRKSANKWHRRAQYIKVKCLPEYKNKFVVYDNKLGKVLDDNSSNGYDTAQEAEIQRLYILTYNFFDMR